MNTTVATGQLFFESPIPTRYLWNNLIIEKRVSMNWLYKLYEGSILQDFWLLLSSPVDG